MSTAEYRHMLLAPTGERASYGQPCTQLGSITLPPPPFPPLPPNQGQQGRRESPPLDPGAAGHAIVEANVTTVDPSKTADDASHSCNDSNNPSKYTNDPAVQTPVVVTAGATPFHIGGSADGECYGPASNGESVEQVAQPAWITVTQQYPVRAMEPNTCNNPSSSTLDDHGDHAGSEKLRDDNSNSNVSHSTSTGTSGRVSIGRWARDRQHRTPPADLTDDERMTMLRHVRPSVFGELTSSNVRLRSRNITVRPRSAADVTAFARRRVGTVEHGRISALTPAQREYYYPGISSNPTHKPKRGQHREVEHDWTKACKRTGVLAHDSWVDVGGDSLSMSASTAMGLPSRQENRYCCGSRGGSSSGGGGVVRAESFVNSVAFGVNMGMLEALSSTATTGAVGDSTSDKVVSMPPLPAGLKTAPERSKRRGQSASQARQQCQE